MRKKFDEARQKKNESESIISNYCEIVIFDLNLKCSTARQTERDESIDMRLNQDIFRRWIEESRNATGESIHIIRTSYQH